MRPKITTKGFIEKAKEVHGNSYDYSLVDYQGTHKKVKIICPKHGEFLQTPNSHCSGSGCKKCSINLLSTLYLSDTKEFIKKAKEVHGSKYDYSIMDYKGAKKEVKIICPIHGEFLQMAYNHTRGNGCPKCHFELLKDDAASFIEKAKEVHGDKYDYSLVDYKNSKEKIKIICPQHGEFLQSAHCHLQNNGCPKCGNETVGKKLTYSTDIFLQKAKKIHGNTYDYSLVDYKHSHKKVIIICRFHGKFIQTPGRHLHGAGCPDCMYKRPTKEKELTIYTTKSFIEKAKKIHCNKYDYSLVDYQGVREKVKIICPQHGEFLQQSGNHLRGKGCKICGIIKGIETKKNLKEKEQWEEKIQ